MEEAGKLVACDDTKYVAFAACIEEYLPKAAVQNGVAGTQVAVTMDDGEGAWVTKDMFLDTFQMELTFPKEAC